MADTPRLRRLVGESGLRRAARIATWLLAGVAACILAAAVLYVARDNIRERDRLLTVLRERNNAALDSSQRATRRIDLLSGSISDLGAQVQALREQVISLGATPVSVARTTTTTVRRSGVTPPPATVRPGPAPATTTTTRPATTTTTTRPCGTSVLGRCLLP